MRLAYRIASLTIIFAGFVAFPLETCLTSQDTLPQGFYSGSISITVKANKLLLSGARVTITRIISLSPLNVKTITGKTNRYGEYNRGSLDAGTYGIRIDAPGYSPQEHQVVVGPGLTTPLYTYEMIPDQSAMGVIIGKVFNRLGKGIPKAQVNIIQLNTGMEFVIESDTEGNYERKALVPGKYSLTVQATNYRSSRKTVKMRERQVLKQDFKLKLR
jgi:hypothetical protein